MSSISNATSLSHFIKVIPFCTGSTSPEEVLEHYRSQRDTDDRLNRLRNAAEIEKRQLEKLQESLTSEFERYKYAEAKDAEQ